MINYLPCKILDGPSEGQYLYRLYETPVIEFSKSYFCDKQTLVNGRIFAKVGWLDDEKDNKIFKSSYSRIERWIKKRFLKIRDLWWVSPQIEKWSDEGGELALGSPLAYKTTTLKEKS